MDNNRDFYKEGLNELGEFYELVEYEYIEYGDELDDEFGDKPNRKLSLITKFLALVTLISFLALSYPWIEHLVDGSIFFIQQDQILNTDEIVAQAKPAIVSIEVTNSSASVNKGTGFIITAEGVILTNAHIVENAKSIQITFNDGEITFSNKVEIVKNTDLALIYTNKNDLPYLSLEKDEPAKIDDIVTIIGNPLGYNKIAQRGKVDNFYEISNYTTSALIINIPIKPGNSGSPVLNAEGNVVGVIFASLTYTENDMEVNKALAIPIAALFAYME